MANSVDDIVDATLSWSLPDATIAFTPPDATISWSFSTVILSDIFEAGDVIWDHEGNPVLDSNNLAINED